MKGRERLQDKLIFGLRKKVELFYFTSSPAVYIADILILQTFFSKDQWKGRMSSAKAGTTALFKKYFCQVKSCPFYLPTQWWVEPVTAQQDGSKARDGLLQQVSSAHPTSPHFIPPKASRQAEPSCTGQCFLADLSALHVCRIKAGDCQPPTQLPSKGSPLSKYTLDLIFSCWFMGISKLGGICKGRIARVTGFLSTQGYIHG